MHSIILHSLHILSGIMAGLNRLDLVEFSTWVYFGHIWTLLMAIFVVFVPPAQEALAILSHRKADKPDNSYKTANDFECKEINSNLIKKNQTNML